LPPKKNLKSSFSLPLQGEAGGRGVWSLPFRPPSPLMKSVRIFSNTHRQFMGNQNKSYPRQNRDGSSESKIQNRELHRVSSTAIIHKDYNPPTASSHSPKGERAPGKYLLLQRNLNKKVFPGKWTVPGGKLETDDYLNLPKTTSDHWYFAIDRALRREIMEETSLEVGKLKYLLDLTFLHPDGVPGIILSFYCDYKSGDVKLDEDNIDFAWVTYGEAKNYDLVEGLLEEIEMVDKILKGEKIEKVKFNYKNNNY